MDKRLSMWQCILFNNEYFTKLWILIILLLFCGFSNCTKWLSTSQQGNIILSERFTFYQYNNAQILRIKGYSPYTNFYEYIQVGTPYYTALRKLDTNNSPVWEKVYQITPGQYSFDVLPDETSIYSLSISNTQAVLVQYEASTGKITNGYQTLSYISNANSIVSTSYDSQSVYFTLYTISTNIASLWKISVGSTGFIWSTFTGFNLASGLLGIDRNKVFKVISKTSQPSSLSLKLIDFSSMTSVEKWSSSISCPVSTCTAYHSEASTVLSNSKISALIGYNNILIFMFINSDTGSITDSRYKAISTSGICTDSISLKVLGNYLYGIFKWSVSYIFIFDYTTMNMINYFETTSTSLSILDGYYTNINAYLVGYFLSGNKIGHVGRGPISAIAGQNNVYYSSFSTQSLASGSYNSVTDTVTTVTASSITTTPVMTFVEDTSSFYYPWFYNIK